MFRKFQTELEQYRINDLERLSGVKAHTIRIWEKRYLLIQPSRTVTNRRFYNSAQLRKLMNVAVLVAQGDKISNLAALTEGEIAGKVELLKEASSPETVSITYINELTRAMLAFDEAAFEQVVQATRQRFGLHDCMVQVVYPFLRHTGILWLVNKAAPAEEHFALCIIRRKLIAAIDALPPPAQGVKKFMLFLPAAEWHEIGLLMACYMIRVKGHSVIYLGQNVPATEMERVCSMTSADYLFFLLTSARSKETIEEEMALLHTAAAGIPILVAGNPDALAVASSYGGSVIYLKNVDSLSAYL
ncbi:MAG: MerR family transcriptional regulator [Taibaiella sp.]|nr:MerR family transcriptional regulator [Taibaiella sp.]